MAVILTRQNLAASRPQTGARGGGDENTVAGLDGTSEGVSAKPDDTVSKILKMVPGEVSAAYTAALALGDGKSDADHLPIVAFVLCLILIPLLLIHDGKKYSPPVAPDPRQYVIQGLAFTAWAFSIRNPLAVWSIVVPVWIPALAMLFIPIFGGLIIGNGDTNGPGPGPNGNAPT